MSWGAEDIGFEGDTQRRVILKKLFPQEMGQRQCRMVESETPADAGRNLARCLRDDGVI